MGARERGTTVTPTVGGRHHHQHRAGRRRPAHRCHAPGTPSEQEQGARGDARAAPRRSPARRSTLHGETNRPPMEPTRARAVRAGAAARPGRSGRADGSAGRRRLGRQLHRRVSGCRRWTGSALSAGGARRHEHILLDELVTADRAARRTGRDVSRRVPEPGWGAEPIVMTPARRVRNRRNCRRRGRGGRHGRAAGVGRRPAAGNGGADAGPAPSWTGCGRPAGPAVEVQPHLLRALGHGGNYVVGAYRPGGSMVGASVAFFTAAAGIGDALAHHRCAAGKGRSWDRRRLKWHQRRWALERGLTTITWTYDPLIARNSFFNLTRLGARPESYFVDFYGVMDDGPNRGQPTDRMQVRWDLTAASTVDAERAVLQGRARRPWSRRRRVDRGRRRDAAVRRPGG